MTTSERIESLLDDVQLLQFGIAPKDAPPGSPKFVVLARQEVATNQFGSSAGIEHKVLGESIIECLEQLQSQVDGAGNIKKKKPSQILTPGGRRE